MLKPEWIGSALDTSHLLKVVGRVLISRLQISIQKIRSRGTCMATFGTIRLGIFDPNGKQSCAMSPSMCSSVTSLKFSPEERAAGLKMTAAAGAVGLAAVAAPEAAGIMSFFRGAGTALLAGCLGIHSRFKRRPLGLQKDCRVPLVGSLTGNLAKLSAAEISTGERFAQQEGLPLTVGSHVGEEFVDAAGKTYDAMGQPFQQFNYDVQLRNRLQERRTARSVHV